MINPKTIMLPLREWLELGQAMTDKMTIGPKWFRAWHTQEIMIGENLKVKADGKLYKAGRYFLADPFRYF